MRKTLSVIFAIVMLLSATAVSFADTRVIQTADLYLYMRDARSETTYEEKIFDADFAEKVELQKGILPQGLEIKKTTLPSSPEEVWALTGFITSPDGTYRFWLKCTTKDGTEKTAYGEIRLLPFNMVLPTATLDMPYSAMLFRFPQGSDVKWEIEPGLNPHPPKGLELKEMMDFSSSYGLYLCGVPTQCGSSPLEISYTTGGGKYKFSIRYEVPVDELALPSADECYLYEDLVDISAIPAGWQTADLDGDGKSFEIIRTETGDFDGYTDFLCSVSGENGCDDVLYTPYFFTFSDRLDIYRISFKADYEIYYTTEDTLDLSHYTKLGDYNIENTTGHRTLEIIEGIDNEEAHFFRLAFRHKTENANQTFIMNELAVKGNFCDMQIFTELEKDVSELVAEYSTECSYKVIGELPEWCNLKETEKDGKKVLALEGKTDKFDLSTFILKVFDKDNVLQYAVEVTVKAGEFLIGDANLDNKINTGDATAILKYAAGLITLTENELYCADISRDGIVNTGDAVLVLRVTVGMG